MFTMRHGYQARRPGYVSEYEQFMDHFLEEYPEVIEDQRKGWFIFWDHKVDFEEWKKAGEDSVPMKDTS